MKTSQLQIRVSPSQKRYLQKHAKAEGLSVSEWVLKLVGAASGLGFIDLVQQIAQASVADEQPAFAALSDYLASLSKQSFFDSVPEPEGEMSVRKRALIASMVEYSAARIQTRCPEWTSTVPALDEPLFLTTIQSLRPYLLRSSPIPFKRRNIYIDSSVGGRV